MLFKDDQQNLIDQLRDLPRQARNTVEGLNDEQLDTPYRDGGWTVRQVIHHLADSHINSFVRFKLIITENHPTLKPYDQELWAELADTTKLPIEPSLLILDGVHARWAALLESLPDDAWVRTAFHPEVGTVRMSDLLYNYVHHGRTHLGQIKKLREARGW